MQFRIVLAFQNFVYLCSGAASSASPDKTPRPERGNRVHSHRLMPTPTLRVKGKFSPSTGYLKTRMFLKNLGALKTPYQFDHIE